MANEQLIQRGYLADGQLRGDPFGSLELLDLGATSVGELISSGLDALIPSSISFPFTEYKSPKAPTAAKPDRVYVRRSADHPTPVAVAEFKAPREFSTERAVLKATEQALHNGLALGVRIAIATDGALFRYVDVDSSRLSGAIQLFREARDLNPGVLINLLQGDAGVVKDPRPLAESVWQKIWHATKAEPKECLLTFVEIFVLKFLSDNLPIHVLPEAYSFYRLIDEPSYFRTRHGMTAIEYYVSQIRPKIKSIFPDNTLVADQDIPKMFGLQTMVSKTSVINGFAFLQSSQESLQSFNRAFIEILHDFNTFGPLTTIDPEFKLRLYETFLRRSARQQRLGQFFTPRNVVRSMIRMARLGALPKGAVVLDPAAGVGGFVLEPLLFKDALPDNYTFAGGKYDRRVVTLGIDMDDDVHILAKANMLLHLVENLREPATTVSAVNAAMADTFLLMNENQTLGSLLNPPTNGVDVILTNPPYVTKGSGVYGKEINELKGARNGLDLRDYYEGSGLGVESLFVRYISGALKPGGRAFIVVPLGMLNRTEPKPKRKILGECNLLASIQLPENAFFNTAQKTCVIVLEKRHTPADPRPDVFCGIARSVGETLNHERIPTPDANDFADIAECFAALHSGDPGSAEAHPLVKLVPAGQFTEDDRWDVIRFWTDDELVKLGFKEPPIERVDFIDTTRETLEQIAVDLQAAQQEIANLQESAQAVAVPLADELRFKVYAGERITNEQVRSNPGDVPVYSCFTDPTMHKGYISESWLESNNIPILSEPFLSVMANGASAVGKVFLRRDRCAVTDDVVVVEVLADDIDIEYAAVALRSAIAAGGYLYEAKLFQTRVKQLSIDVPVSADGTLDTERQSLLASAVKRFDAIRERLVDLGKRADGARIVWI